MDRQPDRRGVGHRAHDSRPHSSATGRRRVRVRADPQALTRLGPATHLRWRRRGQIDRAGLFGTATRARTVDVAPAGGQGRGTEYRCPGQRQHDRADAKNNQLDRTRAGQSQHPQTGFSLRTLSRHRSAPARRTVRVALHAEPRKLAGHGGIRTRRSVVTVSRSAHPRQADLDPGSRNLGGRSQQASCQSRLAVHRSRRPH
jgi:hypothetical protein